MRFLVKKRTGFTLLFKKFFALWAFSRYFPRRGTNQGDWKLKHENFALCGNVFCPHIT
jgi:hypothetical protein